ncbi:Alanine-tRNA ligase, class IIc [Artemisia annua]|uniref:Alanine-tRNA ligase, class IIc n=1 Tax=Artemisia annua TaxID=35608 RepID=A0A2U1KTT6_ARTAN|nr:Alanine-tRNA ligase, class IIc [Artemisia annua]
MWIDEPMPLVQVDMKTCSAPCYYVTATKGVNMFYDAFFAMQYVSYGREVLKAEQGFFNGYDAFVLWDTFGFPLDLTQLMAEERHLVVDIEDATSTLYKGMVATTNDKELVLEQYYYTSSVLEQVVTNGSKWVYTKWTKHASSQPEVNPVQNASKVPAMAAAMD